VILFEQATGRSLPPAVGDPFAAHIRVHYFSVIEIDLAILEGYEPGSLVTLETTNIEDSVGELARLKLLTLPIAPIRQQNH
jgi:hypothetical protein